MSCTLVTLILEDGRYFTTAQNVNSSSTAVPLPVTGMIDDTCLD